MVEFVDNDLLEGINNFALEDCMKIFPLKKKGTHLNMGGQHILNIP